MAFGEAQGALDAWQRCVTDQRCIEVDAAREAVVGTSENGAEPGHVECLRRDMGRAVASPCQRGGIAPDGGVRDAGRRGDPLVSGIVHAERRGEDAACRLHFELDAFERPAVDDQWRSDQRSTQRRV